MQWSRLKSIVIGVVHGKVVWHMALTCMGGDTSGGAIRLACFSFPSSCVDSEGEEGGGVRTAADYL